VGELEGVREYRDNQEIGRTGAHGTLFVPNMNSYTDNQIAISDKDIPINYSISNVLQLVSPPLRSGSLIQFDATRIQAITGILKVRHDNEDKPVEYREVTLVIDGKQVDFPTGKGGELYLENIKAGHYAASFTYAGQTCSFELTIPGSEEVLIDLGEVICVTLR
jgi:outer membrane usher protein